LTKSNRKKINFNLKAVENAGFLLYNKGIIKTTGEYVL